MRGARIRITATTICTRPRTTAAVVKHAGRQRRSHSDIGYAREDSESPTTVSRMRPPSACRFRSLTRTSSRPDRVKAVSVPARVDLARIKLNGLLIAATIRRSLLDVEMTLSSSILLSPPFLSHSSGPAHDAHTGDRGANLSLPARKLASCISWASVDNLSLWRCHLPASSSTMRSGGREHHAALGGREPVSGLARMRSSRVPVLT